MLSLGLGLERAVRCLVFPGVLGFPGEEEISGFVGMAAMIRRKVELVEAA